MYQIWVCIYSLFSTLSGYFHGLLILFVGFSRQEHWSGLPFPSPVDHILSELSTMTHPSLVALHGMAHSFTELDKAGTTDWFQIGKGVHQGCILPPCWFNLYAKYIMRNAGLDEVQAGIKIARRNINNIRYTDNTTLMAESEEELKSLLMKLKEESEIQYSKI